MLTVMNLPRERSARVRTALSQAIAAGGEQELATHSEAWLLRSSGEVPFRSELGRAGAVRLGSGFLGAHLLQYGLWILGWVILGRGALSGRVDPGWMAAWGLVLGTLIPLQLAGAWFQSRLAASVAALLKTRLLRGAMRLDPDRLRREGAGFLFGRVVEAETFESLALGGAFPALVGVVELPIAMVILAAGAGGVAHAVVLCAFVAITAAAGAVLHRARDRVTDARLDLTRGLVERMLGHRTRLVQLARERWSEEEDPELVRYADLSRHMDRWTALIGALPRSWLVASLACLAWPWMRAADPMGLAIGLGGTLLAADSLANLVTGMPSLSGAIIAWRRVAPVAEAAVTGDAGPRSLAATWAWDGDGRIPTFTPTFDEAATKTDSLPLLSVKNITYQYPGRVHPALVAANLEIGPGDRVLITGPSGGGKSTLIALVAGRRRPDAGSIRFRGLARDTLGSAAWRRRILAVPQFHENHILSESLAFNLLMGRSWPPRAGDLELAGQVCAELGLGDLIERMPSGLLQPVGESGWELSHGERSRVFLARAILQGADLVLLDETFGALDPESLSRSLTAALEHVPTLLVVAHP
jgi:ATP-binding cassette subfamily B protein